MRIKIYLLLVLAILSASLPSFAQNCGSDVANERLIQRDPAFARKMQQRATRWAQAAATASNRLPVNTANGIVYEIPVVVHVMHTGVPVGNINNPTDATINTYIDFLNSTYAASWSLYDDTLHSGTRIPIKFVLAKRTPGCNPVATTGIVRMNVSTTYPNYTANGINLSNSAGVDDSVLKSLSYWPSNEYYNIWMVNYIDGPSGGTGGYAYFPGAPSWIDGTVILAQYATPSGGSYYYAVPHELGHAFGLPHTFQGGTPSCPANANCAVDGDGICDTEPHINLNNGVCASGINPCTGIAYQGVQYNFMNYTACPRRFTPNQRTAVLFNLLNYRAGLINSLGTTPPAAFTAPAAACIPGITNAGNNFDMGPHEISLADMSVSGSGYTNDGYKAYIDKTCSQTPAHLTAGSSYTLSVNTYLNTQIVRAWVDYNNDGTFAASEMMMNHTGTTGDETHTQTFTVPATALTCTPLRIRIMADFSGSAAPQPCVNLSYGQAEDYAVIVAPATVTPTATITAAPTGAICSNTSVTFSATTTNATSPTYQWKKNGVNVGTGATTYTNASWVNGDVVSLVVTSTSGCAGTTITTNSNSITMIVTPGVVPAVSVTANPGTTICPGTSVLFTATPTNGGTAPNYQWLKNGVNVGLNQATYTNSTLVNNDVIRVVLTSNAACASPLTASSADVLMTVNNVVVPSVIVTANTGTSICAGTNVTFTAAPANGGTTPVYQWKKNGVNVGLNQATYSDNTLINSDVISVVLTSNAACVSPATATGSITMSVNSTATPSVSITANPGNTICTGTLVTFTAVPVNGGTTPTYQWKKNGVNVATGVTYSPASLLNGDVITVVLTSNASCASPLTATSPAITMNVGTTVAPTVTISANPGTTICSATSVTFTAVPTNGGTLPVYQWKKNGVNVGTGTNTYTNASWLNGDVITVQLTSNLVCASPAAVTSNALTMSVGTTVTPTITITANTGTSVCTGTLVTFTATATNGGTTPVYQWKKNGVNVGISSTTYGPVTVANGDVITATLTSNAACATTTSVTSNNLTMTVSPTVTPTISITAAPGNIICAGTSVTFTATATNGGTAPAYQWKRNGVNVGTGASYTNAALATGDIITCVLTSNAACASTTTATSNTVTMTVNPVVIPSVTISVNPAGPVCAGTPVTFTATPINGGTIPTYQWHMNGMNVPTSSNTFGPVVIANGDVINVTLTSSAACATPATVSSNNVTMTVNPVPVPAVSIVANPGGTICSGTNVTFTATPTNGGTIPAYQWQLNGVNTGTNAATYSNSGLANGDVVTVKLTSNATCAPAAPAISNAITLNVATSVNPAATISVSPDDTICAGTILTFTATPVNPGTAPLYIWRRNGLPVGTSSTVYTQAIMNDSDIITLEMTSDASCAINTHVLANIITVRVNGLPNPVITRTGHVLNAGTGFTNYQWYYNGIAIAGSISDTLHAQQNGNYTVSVTDNKGCTNNSPAFAYSTVGIGTTGANEEVTFYPNPSRDMVYIQSAVGAVDVRIFTLEGKLVMDQAGIMKLDISPLADGMYTIQIRNKSGLLLKTGRLTKMAAY